MWKIQIFQKINFSKKYFGDEFLSGWVLTIGNDCLDVSKGVANPEDCCKWFWWLQNSHKKWNIFEPKICGLEFSILLRCGIIGWDCCHKFSRCPEWSYLLVSNFWPVTFTFSFLPTSISKKVSFYHFSWYHIFEVNFLGMSSYDPESYFFEKFGIWRLF